MLRLVPVTPSKPICSLEGEAEYWHDIRLTCKSEEGSPQPRYEWKSYSVENVPRPFPPKTTESMPVSIHVLLWSTHLWGPAGEFLSSVWLEGMAHQLWVVEPNFCHYFADDGVLSLFNVSRETSGFYICTSTNRIGSNSYNFTLAVAPSECLIVMHLLTLSPGLSVKKPLSFLLSPQPAWMLDPLQLSLEESSQVWCFWGSSSSVAARKSAKRTNMLKGVCFHRRH